MKRTIIELILTAIALSVANAMISSLSVGSARTLMLTALLMTLLDSMVQPLLKANNIPYSYALLWLITYVFNAVIIFLILKLVKDSSITSIGGAFTASLIITAVERLLDLVKFKDQKQ